MEGGYHGHEGLRRWWDDFLGTFPDYTAEVEELREVMEAARARRYRCVRHGPTEAEPQAVGELIRFWRTRRRLSQMELALDASVSTKHRVMRVRGLSG
jgi:hypothetical protein